MKFKQVQKKQDLKSTWPWEERGGNHQNMTLSIWRMKCHAPRVHVEIWVLRSPAGPPLQPCAGSLTNFSNSWKPLLFPYQLPTHPSKPGPTPAPSSRLFPPASQCFLRALTTRCLYFEYPNLPVYVYPTELFWVPCTQWVPNKHSLK